AVMGREARPWPHLPLKAVRQRNRYTAWNEAARAGGECYRRICRNRGEKIEAGRMGALIGRQRQVGAVGQAKDAHLQFCHFATAASAAAMRATSISATFCLASLGHDSTPSRVMR